MSVKKNYVCSAQAGCNKTFTKYTDLKKHEAAHSPNAHLCRFPGCDFATLWKPSFEIHSNKHTGDQPYRCPHGCSFKTHNPAVLTRHRKVAHGHIPYARNQRSSAHTAAPSASHMNPSTSSQPQLQPQPQPQIQPQPPHQNNYNNMLGAFYGVHARPIVNVWQPPVPFYTLQYHPAVGYFYGAAYPQNGYAGPANAANGLNACYMYPGFMPRPPYQMPGHNQFVFA
ncbi:uncharacterized protein EDB93DRAFT_1249463 [Suillus bovinus]|uniref:uncharacterized protein n=1 Tax=Suillus bovinus TaxID=48563 RepID=UPI001B8856A3|nr:uncharacterized protein EDB93DRAFT_1249463 [Suillus bovinus]KAG2151266.1 hypothetical protein EDB93DRAFT_1249463 [Suillus bovinus]